MKTLKELAQETMDVQNACNLSGVAQSFARVMIELGNYTKGTDERNSHPIVILWLDKMNSLAGIQEFSATSEISNKIADCYNFVDQLAKAEIHGVFALESFNQING